MCQIFMDAHGDIPGAIDDFGFLPEMKMLVLKSRLRKSIKAFKKHISFFVFSCRIKESHNDFAMESFQIISFGNQFEHIKRQFDG